MKPAALSELGRRTADPPISWLMSLTLEQPDLVSLAAGFTDSLSLPVPETTELLNEILSSRKLACASLQYGSTAGDLKLRRETLRRLQAADGEAAEHVDCFARPENLLITHGSQQLLYLITESLCDPGDIVLVEDPTYFVYLSIAQSHGLRCRGIAMQPDGLDLHHLQHTLDDLKKSGQIRRVKLLYLVSYFQNPSGITTSKEKKQAILDLLRGYEKAAGHPIYVLEDAAYRDLRFTGPDVPSALSLAKAAERVIYAGTYSKPFATGVRVGFGWIPERLFTVVHRIKGNHDFGTSNLLQQLLLRALTSNLYDKHLGRLRRRYARKAGVMCRALQTHVPASVRWARPTGGLYVWAQAPKPVSTSAGGRLFQNALREKVLYVPGDLCYAPDPSRKAPRHEMRLSFGSASEEEIELGIQRLGKALHEI